MLQSILWLNTYKLSEGGQQLRPKHIGALISIKAFCSKFCCYYYFFNLHIAAFKAYCAIWVRRSIFRHQASPRVSPRESTQRGKLELWERNVRKFA
jgi:hypothetical protein